MKLKFRHGLTVLAWFTLSSLNLQLSTARAQVTAFTYQGRLNLNGSPANGSYDIQFRLYDAATNGAQVPVIPVTTGVLVSNGLFTTGMDFGDVFHGAPQWLEIAVQPHNGPGFVTLLPRQLITPAPYATFANSAGNLSGTLPATQLTGTVPNGQLSASVSLLGSSIDSAEITDGTITTNDLDASVLNGTFWKLGGNTGANPTNGIFLGTTDNQPLEFKVNGKRGLRLEYANDDFFYGYSPNIVGGHPNNIVSNGVEGAVIGGGGYSIYPNRVGGHFATVVGGYGNTASGLVSTAMGNNTKASGDYSTAIGHYTTASGDYSTAMGFGAKANHHGAFVWADEQNADFASTGTNQFLIRAAGGVAIGTNDPAGAALRVAGTVTADGLGIGTGSPGESLDVVVDESAKSYGGIRVRNVNPTIGGERTVLFDLLNNDPSSGVTYRLQNVGNVSGRSGNFEIYQLGGVAGGARLAITTNGNVGIGTTSPGSTLEVVSANEVGTSDGTGKISAGAQNASHVAIDSVDIQKFDNATTVGKLFINFYGGNVDIGSASATTTIKGTFVNSSDRNLKEDIRPVKPDAMLDRLLQLPVSTWKFKGAEARRHVGPMAQDFHAAFNDLLDLQSDDKTIAPLDEAGVAFVSIQALNQKVEIGGQRSEIRIQKLEAENAELKARLEKLEQLMAGKFAVAK